ncbi:MAG: hypothetical protein L6V93_18135 [Clostridiales bacterium]|nr:MAG: hypothetical protein L6V93_18135 [Clostridiales bacterium]
MTIRLKRRNNRRAGGRKTALRKTPLRLFITTGRSLQKNCSQTVIKEKKDKIVKIGTLEYEPVMPEVVEPIASVGAVSEEKNTSCAD